MILLTVYGIWNRLTPSAVCRLIAISGGTWMLARFVVLLSSPDVVSSCCRRERVFAAGPETLSAVSRETADLKAFFNRFMSLSDSSRRLFIFKFRGSGFVEDILASCAVESVDAPQRWYEVEVPLMGLRFAVVDLLDDERISRSCQYQY